MVAIKQFALAGFAMLGMVQNVIANAAYDNSMDVEVRDLMDDAAVAEFQVRNYDEFLPIEVRSVIDGTHDDLVLVNKRLFFLKAAKAAFKGVKAIGGAIANRKHKKDEIEEDFQVRSLDMDLPLEVRDIIDGNHDDLILVNKRFFLFKAAKAAFKGVKAIGGAIANRKHKHKREFETEEDFQLRSLEDEDSLVEFKLRNLDEDLPLEVRSVIDGTHDDLVLVNKRLFFLKAAKAAFKGVKAIGGAIANRKHKRDEIEEDFQVRSLDMDLPLEVRDIIDGNHDDLVLVNKRLFFLKAAKAAFKGVKAIGGAIANRKHKRDFEEMEIEFY